MPIDSQTIKAAAEAMRSVGVSPIRSAVDPDPDVQSERRANRSQVI